VRTLSEQTYLQPLTAGGFAKATCTTARFAVERTNRESPKMKSFDTNRWYPIASATDLPSRHVYQTSLQVKNSPLAR
jgi:hypothetical protein